MSNIITIPNDPDDVLDEERKRIAPWARLNGWVYVGYNDAADHISQIQRSSSGNIVRILDFVCHGSPTEFNHTHIRQALNFGRELKRMREFRSTTIIYLDACNTGLKSSFGGPISQTLANGTGCTIYGTRGYMTGTFAEGTERCYSSINHLPPYPGSQNATGSNVWIPFYPLPVSSYSKKRVMPKTRSINLGLKNSDDLKYLINTITRERPDEFPMLRMASDVTINFPKDDGVYLYDVYANGGLIRERRSGKCWKVKDPGILLELILKYLD